MLEIARTLNLYQSLFHNTTENKSKSNPQSKTNPCIYAYT